jgi:hypothetical protein
MDTSLITVENIRKVAAKKGYKVFTNDEREFNLNYWGIRTADTDSDTFNDFRVMFWWFKGKLEVIIHSITTDPGLFYRLNPMNPVGCGVLQEGQWGGCWTSGLHHGDPALVQLKPVTLIRDFNKDSHLDIIYDQSYLGKCVKDPTPIGGVPTVTYTMNGQKVFVLQTDFFAVNHHHAGEDSQKNWNWSAACQVTKKKKEHDEFMGVCYKTIATFGKAITYTLVAERDFVGL